MMLRTERVGEPQGDRAQGWIKRIVDRWREVGGKPLDDRHGQTIWAGREPFHHIVSFELAIHARARKQETTTLNTGRHVQELILRVFLNGRAAPMLSIEDDQ